MVRVAVKVSDEEGGALGLGLGFIEGGIDDVVGAGSRGRAGGTPCPAIDDYQEDFLGASDFDPVNLEAAKGDGIAGSLGVEGGGDDLFGVAGSNGNASLGSPGFGV